MSQEMWKNVKEFTTPTEARLAYSFLTSKGITCRLRDEQFIGMQYFYSLAMGGVRLDVLSVEYESAIKLLQDVENNKFQLAEGETDQNSGIPCPRCGSSSTFIVSSRGRSWALLVLVLIYIPLPFLARDVWHCKKCQLEWKVKIGSI